MGMANFGQVSIISFCTEKKKMNSSDLICPFFFLQASADETVRVIPEGVSETTVKAVKIPDPIKHPVAVRAILPLFLTDLAEPYLITAAGDVLRTFDVSSLEEPEMVSEIDGHWHDITAIRLWPRKSKGDDGKTRVEPWIITTSLDTTIRKWRLAGRFLLCTLCTISL